VVNLQDGSTLVAELTTIGRRTGQPRTVQLRFIYYQGSFYASSSNVAGKHWCQNMIKHPAVKIRAQGKRFACLAREVTDQRLRRHILELRDSTPGMARVVFELKPTNTT
jgi:deazaflavin-dependent oxidoreductase (nitroreductase family)